MKMNHLTYLQAPRQSTNTLMRLQPNYSYSSAPLNPTQSITVSFRSPKLEPRIGSASRQRCIRRHRPAGGLQAYIKDPTVQNEHGRPGAKDSQRQVPYRRI